MVLLPYVLKQSSAEGDPYPPPLRSEPPTESIEKATPTPKAYPAPKYEISSNGFSIWESVVELFSGLLAWFTPAASAHEELPKAEATFPAMLETTIDIEGRVYTETIQYAYDPLYRLTNAIYSSGPAFTYTYDEVGNRQSLETLGETTTYLYDDANRLTHVDGVTYTWDLNGNLVSDGMYTYTFDTANRLIMVSDPHTSISYEYNGLGDRYSQTVDGEGMDYALDLASGLTQVLSDNEKTYLYGNGRIAQRDGDSTEYFIGDALGSVRQLTDENGRITLAKNYKPYGEKLSSGGNGSSIYGFTGEVLDEYTRLIYLRARYYAPRQGRFISKDAWIGNLSWPMSNNNWLYGKANPINYVDPLGLFSTSTIEGNLNGKSFTEVFGVEKYGVSRWGLYALLREANNFDRITLRSVDFRFTSANKYYPLVANSDDIWNVRSDCDRLIFNNSRGMQLSLLDFLNTIEQKAEYTISKSDRWWRPATLQYHWYDLNGEFYSDFYKGSHMPDVIITGGSYGVFGNGSFLDVHDRYGNRYEMLSLGPGLGGSVFEVWEGYASLYTPNTRITSKIPNEENLRRIIEGWSFNVSISIGTVGVGKSWWRVGGITLVGGRNLSMGIFGSIGFTQHKSFNELQKWSWVDEDIPTYGPTYHP